MKWVGIASALVVAGSVGGARAGAGDAGTTTAAPDTHRAFPGVRLLGLVDDQLLLWEVHGRTQLRGKDGTWGLELQLPIGGILDVIRDGGGFLAVGTLPSGGAAVLALSAAGREQARWSIPGDGAYALFTDAGGRHGVTRSGIVDLRPDGTVGGPHPFPANPAATAAEPGVALLPDVGTGGLSVVLSRAGSADAAPVVCVPSSLAMAHPMRGACERPAPAHWRFVADFLEPPLVCGSAIAIALGPARKGGSKATREIALYSWDNGKRQAQLRSTGEPAMACAPAGDALLIGDNQLRLLWPASPQQVPIRRAGRGRVRDVAITDHLIAYRTEDSLDVVVIPRPAAAR